jgi:hypothetical protein
MLGSLVLLTPLGALVAVTAVIPLAALAAAGSREARGRRALGLPAPPASRRLARPAAVAAVVVLLGLAAAQPALQSATHLSVRTDAEALFVLDNSRSMLASSGPNAPTRLARAKAAADAIRNGIADVPSGVATLSDRVLPNLFANADPAVFRQTVAQAVGIEQPPPASSGVVATSFAALGAAATENYFSPSARHRLLVVLTDGESLPFDQQELARRLRAGPGVHLVIVDVTRPGEAVYSRGRPEPGYHPDPTARLTLSSLAAATDGTVVNEGSTGRAVAAARTALGTGSVVAAARTTRTRALAPLVILAAFLLLLPILLPGLARSCRALAAGIPKLLRDGITRPGAASSVPSVRGTDRTDAPGSIS